MTGPRILVVEDEGLVALMLEDMLEGLGCELVGSAASVAKALTILEGVTALDGALLDLSLGGELSYPVANVLAARGVPFAFVSGYGRAPSDRFPETPILSKPIRRERLEAVLREFRTRGPGGGA